MKSTGKILRFRIKYIAPFLIITLFAIGILFVKVKLVHGENQDEIEIVETMKQYVTLMISFGGFSLVFTGFLLPEISSLSVRKEVYANDSSDNKKQLSHIEDRKNIVSAFLNSFIISAFGALVTSVGVNELPGHSYRALVVFVPCGAFMLVSTVFLMIGVGRIIDVYEIERAKKYFWNLALTLLLFGVVEFAGTISDATDNGRNQNAIDIELLQLFALISSLVAGFIMFSLYGGRKFSKRNFEAYSFVCTGFCMAIYLYSEFFIKESATKCDLMNVYIGVITLVLFSGLMGGALAYLNFDRKVTRLNPA